MPVQGSKLVAKNIELYGGGFLRKVNKTMNEVRAVLDNEVTKNITLSPNEGFTEEELVLLGHPYARKWGEKGMTEVLPDPYWLVHTRSGKLLSSKKSGIKEANVRGGELEATAYVKLDESIAPYARYIVWGSPVMIPRPVLQGSLDNVEGNIYNHIKNTLQDLTFNFKAGAS